MATLMQKGIDLLGGEAARGTERLRNTRDFMIFISERIPLLVAEFNERNK